MNTIPQTPLFTDAALVPLTRGAGHYIAVLQRKPGERQALELANGSVWERMTPLLVYRPGRRPGRDPLKWPAVRDWVRDMSISTGKRPTYLDVLQVSPLKWVEASGGKIRLVRALHAAARKYGWRTIPTVGVGEKRRALLNDVSDAMANDRNGVALRFAFRAHVPRPGRRRRDVADELLGAIGATPAEADLLLDLGYVGPDDEVLADDVAALITELASLGAWRGIALIGSSIPRGVGGVVKEDDMADVPRREWQLWKSLRAALPAVALSFGDYAIQGPLPPDRPESSGATPLPANIRYTVRNHTVFTRGRDVKTEGHAQYQELCGDLAEREDFCDDLPSWGDTRIYRCAQGKVAPEKEPLWRAAGTSHHFQFVTDQLAGRRPR